jgi:hypothetical protein
MIWVGAGFELGTVVAQLGAPTLNHLAAVESEMMIMWMTTFYHIHKNCVPLPSQTVRLPVT